jgi:sugar phosphate isomerase/epimerase
MSTRRDFLRAIPLFSAGLLLSSITEKVSAKGQLKTNEIGIQLYTLRQNIQSDLNATLKALGKIGYTNLEAYGFDGRLFGQPATDFQAFCNDLGMTVRSSHAGITAENATVYAEKAAQAGLEYLILPSMMGRPEKTIDDFKKLAAEMNLMGESCQKSGIKFGYHNHGFEFNPMEGQLPYEVLLKETDESLVSFQMDIYWVRKAGHDPLQYFTEHPGRFQTWHIKDMSADGESCIVGNGMIDFNELISHPAAKATAYYFVEQEHYAEGTPLYCAEQSYRYIQSQLFNLK